MSHLIPTPLEIQALRLCKEQKHQEFHSILAKYNFTSLKRTRFQLKEFAKEYKQAEEAYEEAEKAYAQAETAYNRALDTRNEGGQA